LRDYRILRVSLPTKERRYRHAKVEFRRSGFRHRQNDGESDYTLAAVSALARKSGLSDDDIAAAQRAQARDPRTVAALRFSEILLETRGHVSSSNLDALTEAGFTDGEVAEIVACVVLNIYRNYFNLVAGPEIDFPAVKRSVTMG
jgi:hypothetical protein